MNGLLEKLGRSLPVSKRTAILFILLMGTVSLFSDMTYEGARSINGQYIAVLGASATAVGFVAGFGELIGYGLRLVSGYISDRTRQYWTMTIIGYGINVFAVPFMALAGRWEIAALLMMAERLGKAIRSPPKDAMLSHATKEMGRGWGFGILEAMDQLGALLGPTIVAVILFLRGDYQTGYLALAIPAILATAVLLAARYLYPRPESFEEITPKMEASGIKKTFWIYLAGVALIAAAYADFPLIAFHFEKTAIAPDTWIPLLYAIAMGVDAVAALVFGRMFDRIGFRVLAGVALVSAFFAPLVFLGDFNFAILGMMLWGIGMGAQESIMKAGVAEIVSADKRGTAYGIFNTGYGLFWFIGSALMGILYDLSISYLVLFSIGLQLASVPVFLMIGKSKG
ncbi:MFS transporter [Methanocella sp. CWC-04]|uniref:MFS transporter n=1 Tax=Methanooceanicella nereidis TaxID=2052831 RepID=A0AAP2W7B3_9EURY|nr:MFS transporter [Methanocella sp. CWC-04]MCD1296232.1 MFS transporter [Methanocella sp. CWC-04]